MVQGFRVGAGVTGKPCQRKGCRRQAHTSRYVYCSAVCSEIVKETSAAYRLHSTLGESEVITEYVDAVDALTVVWDRVNKARWRLRRNALEAGWTPHQFSGLINGTVQASTTGGDG